MSMEGSREFLPKAEATEHIVALLKRHGIEVDPTALETLIHEKWKSLALFAHSIHYAFEMEALEAARLESEKKAKKETGQ